MVQMNIDGLHTIVFSGGGTRGLSYIGFLMAFQDTYGKTVGQHFHTFCGSSVGALFALFACLNISVEDGLALFEAVGLDVIFDKDPTWLITNFALNSGEALRQLLLQVLAKRSFGPATTFAELRERTSKNLVVTVVDLNSAATLYFDASNQGRDLSVVAVVMGSMALPPMFPPVAAGPYLLTDGGLTDNFSIAHCNPETTLGVRTSWYIEPGVCTTDIATYYTRILSILQLSMHALQASVAMQYPNNVYIDLGPISPASTNVNVSDVIFKGYRASMSRFACKQGPYQPEVPTKFLPASVDGPSDHEATYLKKIRAILKKKAP